MPKYARLATGIGERIVRGEWKVGEQIPPVAQLQREYSLNRVTILKALRHLEAEGYLSVEQGRGTFVKRAQVKPYVGIFFGDDVFDQRNTPFSSLLARAAQQFFEERGEELKFYIEHKHLEVGVLDRDLVADLERGVLRGLITAGSNVPLAMARSALWQRRRIPWVDISVFDVARHRVTGDHRAMIEMGLEYIQQTGRRQVAALALSKDEFIDDRTPFLNQLRQRGLTTRAEWLPVASQPTEQGGYAGLRQIWSGTDKPDALLILDDIVAKGAVQAMLVLGVRVPEDLVVISHTNKGSDIFYPVAFTKMELDPVEIMGRAGEMLVELMNNPELLPRVVSIRPVLRLPESVEETNVFTPAVMAG